MTLMFFFRPRVSAVAPVVTPVATVPIAERDGAFDLYMTDSAKRSVVRLEIMGTDTSVTLDVNDSLERRLLTGSITADGTAFVRRSGSLTLAPDLSWMIPRGNGDILAPPTEIRISMGYVYSDGSEQVYPLGIFQIDDVEDIDTGSDLSLSLTLVDRAEAFIARRFTEPYVLLAGTPYRQGLMDLILSRDPFAQFGPFLTSVSRLMPETVIAAQPGSGDSAGELTTQATIVAHTIYVDEYGLWVGLPPVDPAMVAPQYFYIEGERGCTMTKVARKLKRRPGYNMVVARAEGPLLVAPLRATAADTNPASPTNVVRWGEVPYFWTTQLISDNGGLDVVGALAQLQASADTLLTKVKGTDEIVRFSAISDPRLRPDDVVQLKRARAQVYGNAGVSKVTWDLLGAPMQVECRARRLAA